MLHKFLITVFFMVLTLPSVVNGSLKFSDRSEEYYLENGLKVVLIEDKRSPSVVNSIWYRVGSSDEVEGKTGISHILEHMMFKGTSNLGPGEFSSVVKKMGGTENAFTSKDFTGYFQKVHFYILPHIKGNYLLILNDKIKESLLKFFQLFLKLLILWD